MRTPNTILKIITLISLNITNVYADFANGDFANSFNGWTSTGYSFTGYKPNLNFPPKSLKDITLSSSTALPSGLIDIVSGTEQTLYDYFLKDSTPTSTLLLPESNTPSAMINLRSENPPKGVSGTVAKPQSWKTYGKLATSLAQTITIAPGDFTGPSPSVHIRFKLAAVMENPAHTEKQQPFYAVQINNLTTNPNRDNPLFFQWSYAAQNGIPWKPITNEGSNSGSNNTYTYVDWQNFDVDLKTEAKIGDKIELVVIAAGCSPGGHDGHVYLDSVTTQAPSAGLSVVATGPSQVQAGTQITYNYTFTNNTGSTNDVCVDAHIPLTQNTSLPQELIFHSVAPNNTACTFNSGESVIQCCKSNMSTGSLETFSITFDVPENWLPSYGPINNGNFPVSTFGYNPVLGNLVQTEILAAPPQPLNSFLVVDVNGLLINGQPPVLNPGDSYSGNYTCTNTGNNSANPASCHIDNLPDGLSVSGCTKNGSTWNDNTIGISEIVTCTVSGTIPSHPPSREYMTEISSNAENNKNNITNIGSVPFYILSPTPVEIPATLNGETVISPRKVCCGRPVVVYDIPIESDLPATYEIISITGNIQCRLGSNGIQNFVKVFGRPGTCTVIAIKDNQISKPFVFEAY